MTPAFALYVEWERVAQETVAYLRLAVAHHPLVVTLANLVGAAKPPCGDGTRASGRRRGHGSRNRAAPNRRSHTAGPSIGSPSDDHVT
jgi:hypothetical protein